MTQDSKLDAAMASVRPRTAADIPSCAQALREVHNVDGYPVEGVGDAEGWLFPEGLLQAWVAGSSDSIEGHAAICTPQGEAAVAMLIEKTGASEEHIGVIARLFVTPSSRGNALGQALAIAAMQYAKQHDLLVVFDVMTKDQTAIRLYERLGCVRLGTTIHEFGDGQQVPAYCYAAPGALEGQTPSQP